MLNIVLPMAGKGSRFADAGYALPKPMIPVHGVPMIKVVVDNLTPKVEHRFIFVAQQSHIDQYNLLPKLKSYAKNVEIIGINGITEGQVCTALVAKKFFNNNEPLMNANSDQYIDFDINEYLDAMQSRNLDGMIMTMKSQDKKWSYAKTNENGLVIETAEKEVISSDATVGIFNFKKGSDLVRSAEQMIADNIRVNNEFYTCPAYNYLIKEGKKIGIYPIGEEYNGMYGLGIPTDLDLFLKNPISEKIKRTNG
ncbi:glycosyltransferase family 2 protein [Pectobacterium carotovorum]|uniref:glycosyltransferase family 2 protein n=1 Tax=Pectobacterium carotovorum TaxID=554 RepID=UPI000583BBEE|nr:glycosyltransferase family 2 protein [Pectobacterium carotovorum]KHS83001.1 glycosyl transferase family 2 [Pectobacterium carotovorum subsp. carotovorum]MCA6969025.1 glycosyltransferase family 2 protein [Pectobacterium carotovorum]